ncbi:MAG: GNAT family N-acetyltransferase [Saprospiraceae bacterium]|jgi:ribosomal protein S18 acetylase RimI-like enzyme|nr:GNAT family N-acetyltransferase [Saprospiraceae bacterium]
MNTRKAQLADVPQLNELFNEYRLFYKKEADLEKSALFLKERITNNESVIYVAESVHQKLTGFVQLYPLFSSTRLCRLWLLNDLFVLPEFRGQQISVLLINEAKKLAIDTDAVGLILETAKSNDIGNQLYPRTDFVLDEDHNYYYWDK